MKTGHYILIAVIIIVVVAILLFKKDIGAMFTKALPTPPNPNPTAPPPPPALLDYNKWLFKGVQDAKPEVKKLQELLGITVDGIFGPKTEAALFARKGYVQTTLNNYGLVPDVVHGASGDYGTGTSFMDTFDNLFQNGVNTAIQWIS